ncbi:hypothetical protein Scep_016693 [Stephania cephalantha]|uniref:Uncharacterized protein n=1 Tax=Stephania cephalantha TaxID=152367 RepID=A0AAP0NUX1_9MAGN
MQLDPFQIGLDLSIVLYLALWECVLQHLLSEADRQGHRLSGSYPEVNLVKIGNGEVDQIRGLRLRSGRSKGASADSPEKAEGKAIVAGWRTKEGRWSVQRERRKEKIVHLIMETDNGNGQWKRTMKISKSALEARATRRESKSAEEGRRSVQRRDRRMGAERGGEVVGAERERKMEKISNSVFGARRESKPAEEGRRSVQRGERRMGIERSGEVAGARERGSWRKSLQVGADSEEGVRIGGRGEAVGAEAVHGVQRWSVCGTEACVLCVCV